MSAALITGISGFVGRHLAAELEGPAWTVHGYDIRRPMRQQADFYEGEISDVSRLSRAIHDVQPGVIFHLAGILKAENFEDFYASYVAGTIALFEAILKAGSKPLIVIAGSSAIYGNGTAARPITEKSAPRPLTHYAISKAAQELVAIRYSLAHAIPVIRARTFNLLGPGLSPQMACSSFARQIVLAEHAGGEGEITTGALTARRDFVDVRDAARAYRLIAESGTPGGVYNVCSGRAVSMRGCLDILLGLSSAKLKVMPDPRRVQEQDVPIQVGSAERLRRDTRWRPRLSLKQSLQDLLDYWRQRADPEMELR